MAAGDTNLTNLILTGDASIAGACSVGGRPVMAGASAGKVVVAGTVATSATGVTTLDLSGSLTSIDGIAVCMKSDPVANCAHVSAGWVGSAVTLKTWKSDGVTAASTGGSVSYVAVGTGR